MKKEILNLGKKLTKSEQKNVNGGGRRWHCLPEYTQVQCRNYCDGMWQTFQYAQSQGDADAIYLAATGITIHCKVNEREGLL